MRAAFVEQMRKLDPSEFVAFVLFFATVCLLPVLTGAGYLIYRIAALMAGCGA